MGANYDWLVLNLDPSADVVSAIKNGLTHLGYEIGGSSDVMSIRNDAAILVGPRSGNVVQLIVGCLDVELAEWFGENGYAADVSNKCAFVLHAWTLNSGSVAGYALFEHGCRVESDVVFDSTHAEQTELMPNVPVPTRLTGPRFRQLAGAEFQQVVEMSSSLEAAIGTIMDRLGFDVHLADFDDVIDEQIGIRVAPNRYEDARMSGWTAYHLKSCGV